MDKFSLMYEPLLFIHSWVRWIVLVGAVYFFLVSLSRSIRGLKWRSRDEDFIWGFNQALLYQAFFGFTIWIGASPIVRAALKNPGDLFETPILEFWALRHPLTMIFAIGFFHLGRARAKRGPIESRYKIYALTFAIVLIFILSAIPWPFLDYGRQLFRGF